MLTRVDFEPSMAPICNRPDGPEWFTRVFPPPRNEDKSNLLVIWRRFLVALFLSVVIVGTTPGLVSYQPNLVARQFGLCQFIAKSLFPSFGLLFNITSNQPYDVFRVDVENFWEKMPKLGSIPFQPAFYCTKEFETWWQLYLTAYVGAPEAKLVEITETFTNLQAKATKCKTIHAKQIQAFQQYFQVVYRPNGLCRTIFKAPKELKEKVTDRIPKLKILSYVKDKYLYALHFGKIKFPPLPSSPLALAFGPPIPDWWYSPWSDIENAYKKKAERVVPTKHYLPNYLGPLHIDPQYVRVHSTMQAGNSFFGKLAPLLFWLLLLI